MPVCAESPPNTDETGEKGIEKMTIYGRTILFADSKGKIFRLDEKISKTDYFKAYDMFRKSADFSVKDGDLTRFYIRLDCFKIMYYSYEI